ncbi:hypothetical protein ACFY3E_41860 [Streptomyces griseorubiginosus]|uniref:hypothetical protein n=1 Tax=Streptomyces griseorubiginosus TaxID=67304 RepID=UPI0036764C43
MADHNDRTQIPGQRQESPAANFPQSPAAKPTNASTSWRADLREWWDAAWSQGGVLHGRWEDLRQAHELGWHEMANWIKTAVALAGFAVVVLLLDGAATVLADALHRLLTAAPRVQIGTDTSTGVVAVVDQPVRDYIAQHSAGLAVSGSTLYTLWQAAGLTGLIFGFLRSTAARLLWLAWGASSAAMIWSASPEPGRTLATGIAVAVWLLASAFALRGLQLRRAVVVHVAPRIRNEIRPQIHVPADRPADDTPDNVHQLQR